MNSIRKLRMLQTLYSIYAVHSLDTAGVDQRSARLAWAAGVIGRDLPSLNDLNDSEADALVNALRRLTGQEANANSNDDVSWKRPRDRHHAQAFGTHGRREVGRGKDEVIASAGDLAAIDGMWQRLGWTRLQFDAWLTGPTSPLAPKTTTLRTWKQVNRVRWALKALLKRAGLWVSTSDRKLDAA